MKCPNPTCDYTPEPSDWCCEVCGTRLNPADGAIVSANGVPVLHGTTAVPAPLALQPEGTSKRVCSCGSSSFDVLGYCDECGKKFESRPEPQLLEIGRTLASASDIGMKHHVNQDAALVSKLPNGDYFLAIADGVSTAENSEDASKLATTAILDYVKRNSGGHPAEVLPKAIMFADDAIRGLPYSGGSELAEPQATVVTAIVRERQVWIGWVGDSRAYELGSRNKLLTVDDSWYVSAMASGMSREEALADRRAHAITQCLGMRDEQAEPHVAEYELADGASLLLCTDGLWNYYEDPAALAGLMVDGPTDDSALQIVQRFVARANRAGGRDNISAAFLKA